MKKIISWCDSFYQKHTHLYNICIGIVSTGICAGLTWLILFLYRNIFWIVDIILGVNNTLVGWMYESIVQGDGVLSYLTLFSSILLGCIIGLMLVAIKEIDLKLGIRNLNKETTTQQKWRVKKIVIYFFLAYTVSVFSITNYKNKVTAIFNQNLSIVAPYITENEEKIIQSKFSQMESREKFLEILTELRTISKNMT